MDLRLPSAKSWEFSVNMNEAVQIPRLQNISSMKGAQIELQRELASFCPHCPQGGLWGLLPSRGHCDSCNSLFGLHFISSSAQGHPAPLSTQQTCILRKLLGSSPQGRIPAPFPGPPQPLYGPYNPGGLDVSTSASPSRPGACGHSRVPCPHRGLCLARDPRPYHADSD